MLSARFGAVALMSTLALVAIACGSDEQAGVDEGELKQCKGAHLDSAGRCRSKSGAFAPKSCCALAPPTSRRDLSMYTCPKSGDSIKVAFLDADSTLRVSKSGSVSANDDKDVDVLPFVASSLAKLNADGYLTAIVSNQGGIEQGHITFDIAEHALAFTASQLSALGAKIDYFDFAEKKDDNRKPEIGMATRLDELLVEKCGMPIDIGGSMMIGDSGYKKGTDGPHPDGRAADDFSNSDRLFAENLGVEFHEPTDYFGWKSWKVYNIASEAELVAFLEKIEAKAEDLEEEDPDRAESLAKEAADNRKVNGL